MIEDHLRLMSRDRLRWLRYRPGWKRLRKAPLTSPTSSASLVSTTWVELPLMVVECAGDNSFLSWDKAAMRESTSLSVRVLRVALRVLTAASLSLASSPNASSLSLQLLTHCWKVSSSTWLMIDSMLPSMSVRMISRSSRGADSLSYRDQLLVILPIHSSFILIRALRLSSLALSTSCSAVSQSRSCFSIFQLNSSSYSLWGISASLNTPYMLQMSPSMPLNTSNCGLPLYRMWLLSRDCSSSIFLTGKPWFFSLVAHF